MCAQGTLSSIIVLQAGGGFFAFVFFLQVSTTQNVLCFQNVPRVGISKHTHAGSLFHGYLQEKPQGTTIKGLNVLCHDALQAGHPQIRPPWLHLQGMPLFCEYLTHMSPRHGISHS